MSKCSLLGWEGFCMYQDDCSFRNEDGTCHATDDDIITVTDFMEIRGLGEKVKSNE